ncbi:hypothetical protein BJ165DRAFT_1407157 [Panaeolus papilionaceus]|nr:hypothetical protein BJ165DRAFT_1407157 [Panaeolus papilionaceus]
MFIHTPRPANTPPPSTTGPNAAHCPPFSLGTWLLVVLRVKFLQNANHLIICAAAHAFEMGGAEAREVRVVLDMPKFILLAEGLDLSVNLGTNFDSHNPKDHPKMPARLAKLKFYKALPAQVLSSLGPQTDPTHNCLFHEYERRGNTAMRFQIHGEKVIFDGEWTWLAPLGVVCGLRCMQFLVNRNFRQARMDSDVPVLEISTPRTSRWTQGPTSAPEVWESPRTLSQHGDCCGAMTTFGGFITSGCDSGISLHFISFPFCGALNDGCITISALTRVRVVGVPRGSRISGVQWTGYGESSEWLGVIK